MKPVGEARECPGLKNWKKEARGQEPKSEARKQSFWRWKIPPLSKPAKRSRKMRTETSP